MNYFKDNDNNVYAFEFIKDMEIIGKLLNTEFVKISEEEALSLSKYLKTTQEQIQEINQRAYQEIIEVYPIWKQMNIIRNKDINELTLQEYNEMTLFIDEVRAYSDYEIFNISV